VAYLTSRPQTRQKYETKTAQPRLSLCPLGLQLTSRKQVILSPSCPYPFPPSNHLNRICECVYCSRTPYYGEARPGLGIAELCVSPQNLGRGRQAPSLGGPPVPHISSFLPPSHSLLTMGHGSGPSDVPSLFGAPPATPFGQVQYSFLKGSLKSAHEKKPLQPPPSDWYRVPLHTARSSQHMRRSPSSHPLWTGIVFLYTQLAQVSCVEF